MKNSDQSDEKEKKYLLLKPLSFIILLTCISTVAFLIVSQQYMNSILEDIEWHYRQGLINILSVARNAVEPVLIKVRSGKITREEAVQLIRPVIRKMMYVDQDGRNYIFFTSYDGTMLAQPFNPALEMNNLIDQQDNNGIYIFRELGRAAKTNPEGSFVRYHYHLPEVDEIHEKLTYVIGLPEIECYIGTGMYMRKYIEKQKELLTEFKYASILLLIIVLIPAAVSIILIRVKTLHLLNEVSNRRRAEYELKKSEEKYRAIFENAVEGIYQSSPHGRLINVNPSLAKMAGYDSPEEMIKNSPDVSQFYENPEERAVLLEKLKEKGFIKDYIIRFRRKDGQNIWASNNTRVVRDSTGKILYFEGTIHDITERKIADEKIQNLLAEKDLILKEVHHRIKNNMNSIKGLLTLQITAEENKLAAASLADAERRVQSMIMLYDRLYCTNNYRELPVKDYLQSLADGIVGSFPDRIAVKIETHIEDFILNIQVLTPLGIIVNELLTNIMKYAFSGRESGLITITASNRDDRVKIEVMDNGIGIPESISFDRSTGFGLSLVGMLTEQIGGSISIERNNGTRIILEFDI